uniref:Uncharacterized protein n=2 Tax=Macaca TaxID=9539 RepID=A0A2K6B3J9_MACNE|nr:unnamed protein product [Macaca fascicularis]
MRIKNKSFGSFLICVNILLFKCVYRGLTITSLRMRFMLTNRGKHLNSESNPFSYCKSK